MPSREEALEAVRTLIGYIGDDPTREGLLKTPERVVAAWEAEWGAGYNTPRFEITQFDDSLLSNADISYDQMVFVRDISFVSFCEHHMCPFFGMSHVAYLPHAGKIVGISKLARIVTHHAQRLQVQERMTAEIAEFLRQEVSPDCAIMISALHMCMISRGVKQPQSKTVTTALRGKFRTEPEAQAEFLEQARARL